MREIKTTKQKRLSKLSVAVLLAILATVSCVFIFIRSGVNIENQTIRKYLNSGVLDTNSRFRTDLPEGYAVYLFRPAAIEVSNDKDFASSILLEGNPGLNKISNLIPGKKYYYRTVYGGKHSFTHSFKTSGRIRMLSVDGTHNVRDIGGWKTGNGKSIKYGLIFRGAELDGIHDIQVTSKGIEQLKALGIRTEIDLRNSNEVENAVFPIKDFAEYSRFEVSSYIGIKNKKELYKDAFSKIITGVLEDKPVYVHCWGGADRTGTIIALIEGSLGVSKEDVIKDYELTSFSVTGIRKYGTGTEGAEFKKLIEYIENEYDGATFGDKCRNLLIDLGIDEKTLDAFSRKMLED